MKKTVSANIGGLIFHIDDDAYEKLQKYLNTIRSYFSDSEGRDEIIGDIEARIAEMFNEKTGTSKQVVNMTDVDEVIAVMGQPEAYVEGEETAAEPGVKADGKKQPKYGRIYRDPDNQVLGGVCSGISAYFGIDPIWLRLAFVAALLFLGTGILLYIILWIIIPKATTTAEKLEMRGERVNVSNIEKTINEEMDGLKKKFNDMSDEARQFGESSGSRIGSFFEKLGYFLLQLIKLTLKIAVKVLGVLLVVLGVVLLVAIIATALGVPGTITFDHNGYDYSFTLGEFFMRFLGDGQQFNMAVVALLLLIGIPTLRFIYAGFKMLFNIRHKSRALNAASAGLWTVGFIIACIVGVQIARDFNLTGHHKEEFPIQKPSNSQVLYLELSKNQEDSYLDYEEKIHFGDWDLWSDGELGAIYSHPKFDIHKSETDSFELEIIRTARGASKKEALNRAGKITYDFAQKDSVLQFNKFYMIDKDSKWRNQSVRLILKVPVGDTVYLARDMRKIIYDIDNVTNTWDGDMIQRRWTMTERGLECVDCEGIKQPRHRRSHKYDVRPSHKDLPEPETPTAPESPKVDEEVEEISKAKDLEIDQTTYEMLSRLNEMYIELKKQELKEQSMTM